MSTEIESRCRLTEYNIEEVLIEDTAGGNSINLSGYFHHICDDTASNYQTTDFKLFFNGLDGDWRITGIDG